MTEAGWTSGKCVAVPGWYWWREGPGEKHKMVRITKGYKALRVEVPLHNSWMFGAVDGFGGEFKGPITPDSYQQGRVAGLREAEKYALRCLKELQDKIRDLESGKCVLAGAQTKEGVEAWIHAKTLEASRIAKWITARIIEQQAQEGGVGDAGR